MGVRLAEDPAAKGCWRDALRATQLAPEDDRSWYFLSEAYRNEGEHEDALDAADELLRHYPDLPCGLDTRARALFALKRDQDALADVNRAIEVIDGEDADFLFLRALVKRQLGDEAGAAADARRAAELEPDVPEFRQFA